MNIKKICYIILYFNKVLYSYIINTNSNQIIKPSFICSNKINENNLLNNKNNLFTNKIKYKLQNFSNLIRSNNIIPTTLLCFSGRWIANPKIYSLFRETTFIISTLITLLIMSSSMIINDIVDVNVDRINNPNKPLINGSITKKEAYFYLAMLLFLTQILSYNYLPYKMQIISNLAILNIILYTPFFKKITFIKNISCAFLVSFSVIFSSLSANINSYTNIKENAKLLKILFSTIFYGSFYNELLLDICDKEGDGKNKIYTVPVIYGNRFSINLLLFATTIISVINTYFLYIIYESNIKSNIKLKIVYFFPLFFIKLFINLIKIKKYDYDIPFIKLCVKNTNISLFMLLFYMCLLAKVT
jgi:geranylgeranylglycerol-phosphate geranylgeranyltransferase